MAAPKAAALPLGYASILRVRLYIDCILLTRGKIKIAADFFDCGNLSYSAICSVDDSLVGETGSVGDGVSSLA